MSELGHTDSTAFFLLFLLFYYTLLYLPTTIDNKHILIRRYKEKILRGTLIPNFQLK